MDQGLFGKYIVALTKRKNEQEELTLYIKDHSGVELTSEELQISHKKISIQTSSVKKMVLQNKKIESLLQAKGYSVRL